MHAVWSITSVLLYIVVIEAGPMVIYQAILGIALSEGHTPIAHALLHWIDKQQCSSGLGEPERWCVHAG